MNMFKRLNLVVLLCLAGTLSALDIDGLPEGGYDLDGIINQVLDEIGDMHTNPRKLIKGFADALVMAGHGATQRAFGDYEHIAITIGAMGGLRTNERVFNAETFSDAADTLLDEGDYTLGLSVQTLVVQCGVNISRLYLGFRVGGTRIDAVEDLNLSSLHLGLVGHYQLMEGRALEGYEKMFRWRGLSLGSGLLYQRAEFFYAFEFENFVDSALELTARDPKLDLDMTTTIFTIPVELNTAVQFLYIFNVNVGVGADISFGINDASVGMNTTVYDKDGEYAGEIQAQGGGTVMPTLVSPKVMLNLGFKAGPLIIDIPLAYYFVGGFQAGLTLGVFL